VPAAAARRGGEFFQHNPRADDPNYFFARRYLPDLRPDLRTLTLRQIQRLAREAPGTDPSAEPDWIVIKEPGGSYAAETIFWLLSRGRMVFLVRDGRDVVDSHADAALREESWMRNRRHPAASGPDGRRSFIRRNAERWVVRTDACLRAFEALPEERRLTVRYEDLVADTATELGSIFRWLGVDVPAPQVAAIASRHAFESIDPSKRGPGKIFRAATPGLWRESFDEGEQQLLWEVMGDTLTRLGYER
jgi:hypothetical protein